MQIRPKLLYFVTEDWYFCSHRLNLAIAAQNCGYRVTVLTRVNRHGDNIRAHGFELIPLDIERGGLNLWREWQTLLKVWRIYAELKPDIAHHIALKPVLYGGLVALFVPGVKTVSLLAGLGSIFSARRWQTRLLKPIVKRSFRWLLNRPNCRVVVQNSEDRALLVDRLRIDAERVALIRGSGVDIQAFRPASEPAGKVVIALVSRLLWDKGIGEYVDAVQLLRQKGLVFSALLVGEPDEQNLNSVSRTIVRQWHDRGLVDCLGFQESIAAIWQQAHIAVLPSYREGLPKALLEAAACGRPIVTTDTSGCKEVVEDGYNGLLVPVGDAESLANALERLIVNAELRQNMGRASRRRVEHYFSDRRIIDETLAIYRELV
ncbi:MAG: glycosyltransferase family 4 protein [Methylomicrobium sp.]